MARRCWCAKMSALHPIYLTVHRVLLCSELWLMYNVGHMAFSDPSLYFGATSMCVNPANEIQLVIKRAQKTSDVWLFLSPLTWANICSSNIFPPETVYSAFLSAMCPRNICEDVRLSLWRTNAGRPFHWPSLAHVRPHAPRLFVRVLKRKCNKDRQGEGFMGDQKHFTIWQSSMEQISKCLLSEAPCF